jgi:iron complex transport system ATP-binding protein
MSTVIEVRDVSVRRGGNLILDRVSWTVDETDRWVIIGPNGAGKTTLVRLVSAALFPSTGQVSLLDEVIGRVDVFELRPRIGVSSTAVAQQVPADELVRDVVLSAAYAVYGRWREDYRVEDIWRAESLMADLGVGHLARRTFGTLSEGERQRVQIARALMPDPEVLILDEPTAGLDLAGRELLLDTLSMIVLEPRAPASILVTHHVEEIPVGITHGLLLKRGRVVAAGRLEDVINSYWLSAAFDLPLEVGRRGGRWWAQAVFAGRPDAV